MTGSLALVGGGEWSEGCSFDAELLAAGDTDEVVVLPTGAAYEHPDRLVAAATTWFEGLGARVRPLLALDRPSASDPDLVATARGARFLYLAGGNPMHLRSVLVHSPLWDALVAAWNDGATVAGTSAGAMLLCDPAVDLRGGAFTLGLGLIPNMAVIPHADTWSDDKLHRTRQLTPKGMPLVGVDERTALVRSPAGLWSTDGAGKVHVWVDAAESDLSALP